MSINFLKIGSGANFIPLSSDPSGAVEGDIYFNSVSLMYRYYDGSTWHTIQNENVVNSLNTLTGAVVLAAGTNITLTPSGNTITITGTGGAVPTGSVLDFAGSSAPVGYLLAYGQAVSRTTYSDLFTAISTTYGPGDGSTTFNVPDLRGRVTAGKDNMGGTSANRLVIEVAGGTLGATGGLETSAALLAHTHTITDPGHTHGVSDPGHAHNFDYLGNGNTPVNEGGTNGYLSEVDGTTGNSQLITATTLDSGANFSVVAAFSNISLFGALTGITGTNSTGSGSSFGIVQPTIVMNKIIKT